jgi:fumarylacetoacetase
MTPLGPFNGKSFATTISPWIIMADALEPHLLPVPARQQSAAEHFTKEGDKAHYNVTMAVDIGADGKTTRACTSRLDSIYWTVKDMIAHQTCNGCAVRPGDLLATGTVSGSKKGSHGCLLEITKGGKEPFELSGGGKRTYLEDGDRVVFTGWAGDLGQEDCVGFGECAGTLKPAISR